MRDEMYDRTERIRFGWGAKLLLWGIAAALCLLFTNCSTPGPIRRTLDRELGVLCYHTATAMSCLPVQIKPGGHPTFEASVPVPPGQSKGAGK